MRNIKDVNISFSYGDNIYNNNTAHKEGWCKIAGRAF